MVKSVLVKIKGVVQGVGFRPYVYNLCNSLNLFGWVNNDEEGVNIALEAKESLINEFLNTLKNSPPPLAKIDSIKILTKEFENFRTFKIRQSENNFNKSTIISPDMSICQDCINDINDKTNPRYNYALTNCTNCGPRYSIINTIPYDRINTSMSKFELCSFCKEEYINPKNRRYHAQPVCCEKCGPKIELFNNKDEKLKENYTAIEELTKFINQGKIVAIKGIGGFHLVCDATNDKAILELRKRKNRPTKPYAVMFKDIVQVQKFANLNLKEKETITSKHKPITLVNKKQNSTLSSLVAPNIDRLGCFIAYTPLHILLFRTLNNPIIATSANLKDEPIIRTKEEIIKKLGNIVDYILDFNREIINAVDDSIVQIVDNELLKLRNARGYAPTNIKLKKVQNKKILALGANQKSTIAIAFEDNLVLSAHIGDLNSINSVEYFTRTIDTFKRFYDFKPEVLVCDNHPNYESTKWALAQKDIKIIQIQHHYAHILSTMAEYKLNKEVLGICFDGTGYGDDGNIWGGEVFIASQKEYKRVHHFKYFKLLGGEAAVKEPKRIALSLLFESFTLQEVLALSHPLIKQFSQNEIKMLYTLWKKNLNSPLTSSLGRIFDAIASFSNLIHTQTYEGETGLQIEKYYNKNIIQSYTYKIEDANIDISLMVKELLKERDIELICSKFINTLVAIILDISNKYKDFPLVLSGGVFQNRTLLEKLILKLKEEKREFYYSKEIPLNDAGIAIGQLYSQLL